jgi:ABC-type multidrug transport system fused ATPase/permease subunit
MVALFRIANIEEGQILIDGVDLSTIPLEVLRSRIGIIPQGLIYALSPNYYI